ncbi:DUF3047 domain-containing protein [Lentibacter sp.]|uniref:DUF3047 domain-containing protein n=1 Tax=Lentibacter sp. TaxID=2024994 RepID=UPI003F69D119
MRVRFGKAGLVCGLVLGFGAQAFAEAVRFDAGWTHQKFSLFSKNDYGYGGRSLSIGSEGSVSLIYKPLPEAQWGRSAARWSWAVERSVPATDLRNKGGDDRNIALYAVFMPRAEAERLKGASVAKLLAHEQVRVLVYVWGGAHRRGALLDSPYLGARGKTVVLRGAGTGAHSESVDFAADYKRAFGGTPEALVGFAVSADSDDTDSHIVAQLSGLSVK